MPSSLERALRISTGLVVLLSFISLTTVSAFGLEVVLFPVCVLTVMPLLERLDRRTPLYRRATSLVTVFFTLVILPMMIMRQVVLVALTLLCMYILAYLLLHEKKVKDYHYVFLMSFFLLVSACAQNPEPSFGLITPFFTISIVWAFAMLQIKKDGTGSPDLPIGELLPAASGTAFLPAETLRGPGETKLFNGPLAGYLFATSVCCILLGLGIFLVTPRMEAGVFGGSNLNFAPPTAVDRVDLSQGGRIGNDLSPVMRVRFPSEPGGEYDGPLYWRVTTLNRFVGFEWDRVPISDDQFNEPTQRSYMTPGVDRVITRSVPNRGRDVQQDIYLDDLPPVGLPCLPFPRSVSTKGAGLSWDEGGDLTVLAQGLKNSALTYRVRSTVETFTPDQLRQYPARYAQLQGERDFPFLYQRAMGMRAYGVYTQENLSPRSRALAEQITADYSNPYDQAEAMIRFFQGSNFIYSLTFPSPEGGDPIDLFLNVTRSGHCELYATAMALMLRSVGIPARVVSGFRGGEWDPRDEAYVVRKNMAHLWVEVYFIGKGWVTFDPAPESDLPETRIGMLTRILSRNLLNLKMLWFRDVVGYEGGIRLADLRDVTLGFVRFDFDAVKNAMAQRPFMSGVVPRIVFWLLVLAASVWGAIYAVVRWPSKPKARFVYTPDQIRATRLFGLLKRRLGKLGADCTGKTAGEVYAMLRGEPVGNESAFGDVLNAYWRTRFGGRPMDRRQYAEMTRAIRRLGKGELSN